MIENLTIHCIEIKKGSMFDKKHDKSFHDFIRLGIDGIRTGHLQSGRSRGPYAEEYAVSDRQSSLL